jgi:hypothetical protein
LRFRHRRIKGWNMAAMNSPMASMMRTIRRISSGRPGAVAS